MGKVTSIDPGERASEKEPDQAIADLKACTTAFSDSLERLAHEFPDAVALGGFAVGVVCEPFVMTGSVMGDHYSVVAENRMQIFARFIKALPQELRLAFVTELAKVPISEGRPVATG